MRYYEKEDWEGVEVVSGELKAEILRGLLEAQGVPAVLSQEGAGRAIGLGIGPLGEVEILVPVSLVARARQVLEDYYAGKFALDDQAEEDQEPGTDDDPMADEQ